MSHRLKVFRDPGPHPAAEVRKLRNLFIPREGLTYDSTSSEAASPDSPEAISWPEIQAASEMEGECRDLLRGRAVRCGRLIDPGVRPDVCHLRDTVGIENQQVPCLESLRTRIDTIPRAF